MSKDLKVAILAIISIILFVLGYQFMKGSLFHASDKLYSAIFTNVTSLKKSDKVFINGVQVGMIKNISFENPKLPNRIKVDFSVDKNIDIPKNSIVEVIATSLMGNKGLKISFGNSGEIAKPGTILVGIDEKGILEGLTDGMGPLAESSTQLIGNLNTLFDRNQKENFYITVIEMNKSIAALQSTLNQMNKLIAANQQNISGTMSNVNKLTSALSSKQGDIQQIITNANTMTSKLKETEIQKLNQSINELNTMMADINKGKGSLGKLMKDDELYNKLNNTTNSADELLKDMKENPKRYVHFSIFGGKK